MYSMGKEEQIRQQEYNAAMDESFEKSEVAERPVVLKATGLKMAFGGQIVLDDIKLRLQVGEVVLLRGENGSGKTTLLNILTGNLEPDAGTIQYLADGSPRTYHFPRRWWQELNPFDHFTPEFVVREGIGRTWQDVRLFGSQTLRDNIAVGELGHPGENPIIALCSPKVSARREDVINREADAMLARFGLGGREDSSADKISFGQAKRVAIARAAAAGAKVLFLDEPLSGLDRQGIVEVLALLEMLVHTHKLTLIIVEHIFNQTHLHGLVTTHWLLEKGKLSINNCGPIAPGHDQGHSTSLGRPAWFNLLMTEDAEIIDELLPQGALLTRIRRTGIVSLPLEPLLELRDLVVKRGARTVIGRNNDNMLTGFNLTLFKGDITILQAPNGWGKSTLYAAICGLIEVDGGEILLNGQTFTGLKAWERASRGLCALPSDHHTFPGLSVKEVMKLAGNPDAINLIGPLADRICSSLSGGEKQRVGLQAQLNRSHLPTIRILDEPFAALDLTQTKGMISEIMKFGGSNVFIFLPHTSHLM